MSSWKRVCQKAWKKALLPAILAQTAGTEREQGYENHQTEASTSFLLANFAGYIYQDMLSKTGRVQIYDSSCELWKKEIL